MPEKKGIKAKVSVVSIVPVSNDLTLTLLNAETTAAVVAKAKQDLLNDIKNRVAKLTIYDLSFEEVNIPQLEPLQ